MVVRLQNETTDYTTATTTTTTTTTRKGKETTGIVHKYNTHNPIRNKHADLCHAHLLHAFARNHSVFANLCLRTHVTTVLKDVITWGEGEDN